MVVLEDRELENDVFEREFCIAVPVEVTLDEGVLTVLCYSFAKSTAEEFERMYSAAPFSDEAREFLLTSLSDTMAQLEYPTSVIRSHTEYRPAEVKSAPTYCRITDAIPENYDEALPMEDFELDPDNPSDRMAVAETGGRVVAMCGVNDISPDDTAEIYVECSPDYRRQGYGSACVAAMTRYLHSIGREVTYITDDDNGPSHKTAVSAGFKPVRRQMQLVCYRDEE